MNEDNKPKYKRPRTQAQRDGEARYKAKTEKKFTINLNRNTDADIIDDLLSLDVTNMTPLDALNNLSRLQSRLNNRWG